MHFRLWELGCWRPRWRQCAWRRCRASQPARPLRRQGPLWSQAALSIAPAPESPTPSSGCGRRHHPTRRRRADRKAIASPRTPTAGSPSAALPQAPYQIDASKPGWLTGAYGRRRPGGNSSSLEIAEGERRNDLTITVWRTAVIGGRVMDDRGDPLIGAEMRAMRQTYIAGRPQGDTPIRARTDDRGVYRFADLLPGDYIVAVLMNVMSEPPTFAGAIRAGGETPRAYLQTMTSLGADADGVRSGDQRDRCRSAVDPIAHRFSDGDRPRVSRCWPTRRRTFPHRRASVPRRR